MVTKKLRWLPLAAAALFVATCAPVAPREEKSTAPTVEVEDIKKPPSVSTDPVKDRVEVAIQNVRGRQLLTTTGFWTIFHGILGIGPDLTLKDPETGTLYKAVEYIADGKDVRGFDVTPTKYGLEVRWSVAGSIGVSQGHQDQFVCEMGQWSCPADRKFNVFNKDYTFMDFVNHSQMRSSTSKKRNQELSWGIALLAQYKGQDKAGEGVTMEPWDNMYGEKTTLEDMIRYEIDSSVEQAACGGTHRLFGLTWCYHLHLMNGGKTEGVWKDLVEKTSKYQSLAKKHQRPDGAFSLNYFAPDDGEATTTAKISTSGHILEWLALSLSDEQIKEEWVKNAASAVALAILELQDQPIDGGALYHAVHGLQIYYARAYPDQKEFPMPKELMIPLPPKGVKTAAK